MVDQSGNSRIYFANLDSRSFSVNSITRRLINDYLLTINHRQGSFILPVFGTYSVESFVELLGLDMSDVEEEATYISPLDNTIIKDNYRNMQFVAKKYNNVSFRSSINDLIRVNISGAVDFPGTYTMNSNSVLRDI